MRSGFDRCSFKDSRSTRRIDWVTAGGKQRGEAKEEAKGAWWTGRGRFLVVVVVAAVVVVVVVVVFFFSCSSCGGLKK